MVFIIELIDDENIIMLDIKCFPSRRKGSRLPARNCEFGDTNLN